jgi:predicted  nucleic acid-binding Zn-ribbon protein
MTQKALWQYVKDLVECDKNITSLGEDIENSSKHIRNDQATISSLEAAIVEKTKVLFSSKKNLELKELDIKTLQEQEQHKRENLDVVKDQKEYKALEREIDYLNIKRSTIQDETLHQWITLEKQTLAFEEEKKSAEEKVKIAHSSISIKKDHVATIEVKYQQAIQQRLLIVPHIPAEWLTKYDRMKSTVPDPVVPVENDHCSACFYSILYQDLVRLKQSNILLCRNCYRFLYFTADEQSSEKNTF